MVPSVTLFSAIVAARVSGASGWDAVFPSLPTCPIVGKMTIWLSLIAIVAYEQSYHHYGSSSNVESGYYVGVEVVVDDGLLAPLLLDHHDIGVAMNIEDPKVLLTKKPSETDYELDYISGVDAIANEASAANAIAIKDGAGSTAAKSSATLTVQTAPAALATTTAAAAAATTKITVTTKPKAKSKQDPPDANAAKSLTSPTTKSAPGGIPFRFIRATKGDVAAAKLRWADTCTWREEHSMDTCLSEPHPKIKNIKNHYPHYFHLRGKNNECCYYEQPPKMNLPAIRNEGISMDEMLKHYALCCEYMWSKIDTSVEAKSIYIIDLDGIGFRDFAGEVVDFVKKASSFTAAHYPERSGSVFIINVPSWFSVIWNVVKPLIDDVTKKKISILKYGDEAILKALMEKIDIQNIPPKYGGKSMALGQAPEELTFMKHFDDLNKKVHAD